MYQVEVAGISHKLLTFAEHKKNAFVCVQFRTILLECKFYVHYRIACVIKKYVCVRMCEVARRIRISMPIGIFRCRNEDAKKRRPCFTPQLRDDVARPYIVHVTSEVCRFKVTVCQLVLSSLRSHPRHNFKGYGISPETRQLTLRWLR